MQCSHVHQPGHRRAGQQCGKNCAPGFTVCISHGAKNPIVKQAAEKALALVRLPAIAALFAIIEQFNDVICGTCGYPSGSRKAQTPVIRAAQVILDRTGFGPHATMEVRQSDGELDLRTLTDDERSDLTRILGELRDLKDRVRRRINPGGLSGDSPDTPTHVM